MSGANVNARARASTTAPTANSFNHHNREERIMNPFHWYCRGFHPVRPCCFLSRAAGTRRGPGASGHRSQASHAHVSAGLVGPEGIKCPARATRHERRDIPRAASRRSRHARAREESRHSSRQARAAVGGFPDRRGQESVPAGTGLHGGPARPVPAADAHHQRRHPREPGDHDLQRLDRAGSSAVWRQLQRVVVEPARGVDRRIGDASIRFTPRGWSPRMRSRCCAASRPTTCGSSCRSM